ncbi:MAG TPA: hydroxymethylbilane synthase [Ktedonobacterales bacterium]
MITHPGSTPSLDSEAAPGADAPGSTSREHQQLIVGSRGSALAMWQTRWVLDRLLEHAPHTHYHIEEISTRGDRTQALQVPLTQLGDKSMFVAELERALLAGELDVAISPMNDRSLVDAERQAMPVQEQQQSGEIQPIDAAVHSLKDLPGKLDPRLTLAAVPPREDPRDALISRHGLRFAELPVGAVVATSSLRRRAQVLHLRPDLRIVDIRGNVDTRLRKALAPDGPDAVILAVAGLRRLGLDGYITEILPVDVLTPAVGQGALAVEVRADDRRTRRLLKQLDHPPTRQAVTAERAVLATLGGGCQVPLGAHATVAPDGETLHLTAVVASLDGQRLIRVERDGPLRRPMTLGRGVARELLRRGAAQILAEIAGR